MSQYNGNTVFYQKAAADSLRFKDILSDVFKKHQKGDSARQFMAGTPLSTPAPGEMLRTWKRPWIFARVFAAGGLVLLLFYFMALFLPLKYNGIVVPIALLFFWEMNIPRNVPVYEVIFMFFLGGALSLVFTGVFFIFFKEDTPAWFAPLAEEPGKLIAILPFLARRKKSGQSGREYILTGILIGAACLIHALNNGMIMAIFILGYLPGALLLTAACWIPMLILIRKGIQQVLWTVNAAPQPMRCAFELHGIATAFELRSS